MAYSFAFTPPVSVPSAARRIALAFEVHPRLRLEDDEDQALHQEMVNDLVGEALAPARLGAFGARQGLAARYRLVSPDVATLEIEGRAEPQNLLVATLRALDLFARPKPDELAEGVAFDDRRLYTTITITTIEPEPGATRALFQSDVFVTSALPVIDALPDYFNGEDVTIQFGAGADVDLDAAADSLEAFLQDSCAVPRGQIDYWLSSGGDAVSVSFDEADNVPTFRIDGFQGERSALAFIAASLSPNASVTVIEDGET